MAVDPTTPDPKKLLTQSVVHLFGWIVGDVNWKVPEDHPQEPTPYPMPKPMKSAPPEKPAFLPGPATGTAENAKTLANIFAFSNEGRFTPFRTPALFLMIEPGDWVWKNGQVDPARLGLTHLDESMRFAFNLKFWICDRSAYITRLDVSSGTLQRMVVDLETSGVQGRRVDLIGQESSYMARLGQGNH
jgi:hypothetical protein